MQYQFGSTNLIFVLFFSSVHSKKKHYETLHVVAAQMHPARRRCVVLHGGEQH